MNKLITSIFLLVFAISFSQNDSIVNQLEEIIIRADKKLQKYSTGYKIQTLNDSVLLKNTESFTSLLRFNTPIYFKEYGGGGVSSASFRGTSASNTAVIWNGININSINNGQTDFNSFTVSLFDAIEVRSGGGSIEYGSGAIGGTIHLNDQLILSPKTLISNQIVASIGSFQTYHSLYKLKISTSKIAVNVGVSYNQSENDYKYLGTNFKNSNGEYKNFGLNISGIYKINQHSKIKFYSTNYNGERFFSGELPNPLAANDKYKDISYRNLLVYTYDKSRWNQEVRAGLLTEEYQYFADKTLNIFNFGKSKRYLINYNFSYKLPRLNSSLASYSEYESVFGYTDQISEKNRKQFSQSFLYSQHFNHKIFIDAKVRKDFNSDYKVPFSYALGLKIKPHNHLFFRLNGSKNYRVPTYNDLYWPGQGNPDLIPETALQGELGIGYKESDGHLLVDVGVFYISAKDKIIWTPNGDPNRPNVWTPVNLSKTNNKGVEFSLKYKNYFNKHIVKINLNYSYVIAKDEATNKQLIFVPKHLLNGSLGYAYKRLSLFFQQLLNGKVYTTESNSEDFVISSFFVTNIGIDYKLINTLKQQLIIGIKVNNVFNENYQIMPRRPMPNRNFNFNMNYKF